MRIATNCPPNQLVARLTIELPCLTRLQPKPTFTAGQKTCGLACALVVLVLLAATGATLATSYLYSLALQEMQEAYSHGPQQVSYSDVGMHP